MKAQVECGDGLSQNNIEELSLSLLNQYPKRTVFRRASEFKFS